MGVDTSRECAVRDRLLNNLTDAAHDFAVRAEDLRIGHISKEAIKDALE
jgi:hypothetical protein